MLIYLTDISTKYLLSKPILQYWDTNNDNTIRNNIKLKSTLLKFYGRHYAFVNRYRISESQRTNSVLFSFMNYHRVCNKSNTTGGTSGAGTAYPSWAPEFTPGFQWGSFCSIYYFCVVFCRSLFVLFRLAIMLSVTSSSSSSSSSSPQWNVFCYIPVGSIQCNTTWIWYTSCCYIDLVMTIQVHIGN